MSGKTDMLSSPDAINSWIRGCDGFCNLLQQGLHQFVQILEILIEGRSAGAGD
jgi:hypothetical protein